MAYSASKSFMGIDFGTTSCKFGYFINGKVEIFEDEFGNKSMPSYVAFTKDGRLVGGKAKRQMGENPRSTVFAVKKLMGKSYEDAVALGLQFPFKLVKMDHELCGVEVFNVSRKLQLYPEQVAAMLFSKMKYLAEKKLKHPVNAAVISVPPGFTSCQRQATVYAGTIAGFDEVRLVDDSTALVTAISYHEMVGRKTENVAVVDFGGGFISASMITASKTSFKELPSVTLEFGGIDIDENIRDILKSKLMNQNDSINDNEKLRLSAEKAKISLSSQEETTIMHKNERTSLTSNEIYYISYNPMIGPKIVKIFENITTSSYIDQIIFTGEFTKSPFVEYQLSKLIEDKKIKKFGEFPDGVITGAVLESAVKRGLPNRRCSDSILNRTVHLNEDILFESNVNPLYGASSQSFASKMILTEFSGPNVMPIRTGKIISDSLTNTWKWSPSVSIKIDNNKIISNWQSNYAVLLFCLSSKYLKEFKSLENIYKDKEKEYEDECRKKLAVINKKRKECFDSCSESFINDNIEEIQKMVNNSSISEHNDLEELEEEINRLSCVQEEVVKKYSVYLKKQNYSQWRNDSNAVRVSQNLPESRTELNQRYRETPGNVHLGSGSLRGSGYPQTSSGSQKDSGYPHIGSGSQRDSGYPQTSSGSQEDSGYPHIGSGSQRDSGYPQTGSGSQRDSGYPQTGSGSQRDSEYPKTGSGLQRDSGYPQTVSGSQGVSGYPQTGSGSQGVSGYPQTGSGSQRGSGYPQTGSGSQRGSGYPQTGSGSQRGSRYPQTVSGSQRDSGYPQTVSGSQRGSGYPQTGSGSQRVSKNAEIDSGSHEGGSSKTHTVISLTSPYHHDSSNFSSSVRAGDVTGEFVVDQERQTIPCLKYAESSTFERNKLGSANKKSLSSTEELEISKNKIQGSDRLKAEKTSDNILYPDDISKASPEDCLRLLSSLREKKQISTSTGGLTMGIDFGTYKCCVAALVGRDFEVIPNKKYKKTTPSYVTFSDNERYFGEDSKNSALLMIEKTVIEPKNKIFHSESSDSFSVKCKSEDYSLNPVQISSMLIKYMKGVVDNHLGQEVKDAVICVPTYFNNKHRQSIREAAAIAGLNVLSILNEPTAAAINYKMNKSEEKTKNINILVFDLGSGGLSVGIIGIREDKLKVYGIDGTTEVSGNVMDGKLVNHFKKEIFGKHGIKIGGRKETEKLRLVCQRIRCELTESTCTANLLENFDGASDYKCLITRQLFEDMINDMNESIIDILDELFSDCNFPHSQVDEIVMCGGISRVPLMRKFLSDYFVQRGASCKISRTINEDEAVALGAAYHAACLLEMKSIDPLHVEDLIVNPKGNKRGEKLWIAVPQEGGKLIEIRGKKHISTSSGILWNESSEQKYDMEILNELKRDVDVFNKNDEEQLLLAETRNEFESKCLDEKMKFKKLLRSKTISEKLAKKVMNHCDEVLDYLGENDNIDLSAMRKHQEEFEEFVKAINDEVKKEQERKIACEEMESSLAPLSDVQSEIKEGTLVPLSDVQSEVKVGTLVPLSDVQLEVKVGSLVPLSDVQSEVKEGTFVPLSDVQSEVKVGSLVPLSDVQSEGKVGSLVPLSNVQSEGKVGSLVPLSDVQSEVEMGSLIPLSDVQSEGKESSFKRKIVNNNDCKSFSGGNNLKNMIASASDLFKTVDEDESDDDVEHSGQSEG